MTEYWTNVDLETARRRNDYITHLLRAFHHTASVLSQLIHNHGNNILNENFFICVRIKSVLAFGSICPCPLGEPRHRYTKVDCFEEKDAKDGGNENTSAT